MIQIIKVTSNKPCKATKKKKKDDKNNKVTKRIKLGESLKDKWISSYFESYGYVTLSNRQKGNSIQKGQKSP